MAVVDFPELQTLVPAGRLMALDVGSKTIGVATSDALRMLATPVTTLKRGKLAVDLAALAELTKKYEIKALVIGLPILAFLAAIAALVGGALTSWMYGGITPEVFVIRLQQVITVKHFAVGLIKAPFMALVIAVIAAIEGFAVEGSAESLGRHVTAAVVKSIFMVIVLDGVFAVFFAAIDF